MGATVRIAAQNSQSRERTHHRQLHCITVPNKKVGVKFVKVPVETNPRVLLRSPEATRSYGGGQKGDRFAFLVCGFQGFDDHANVRPRLGSRLVSLNGNSLCDSQISTFDDLRRSMRSLEGPLKLAFAEVALNKEQVEMVKAAMSGTDEEEISFDWSGAISPKALFRTPRQERNCQESKHRESAKRNSPNAMPSEVADFCTQRTKFLVERSGAIRGSAAKHFIQGKKTLANLQRMSR